MFGERALEFIKDLSRQHKGNGVATFDENGLRHVFDEMRALFEQNTEEASTNPPGDVETLAGLHFRHAALERNKQCVLSYMSNRLERIRNMRWMKGSVLPDTDRLNMTDQELEYFNSYNKMLATFMGSLGVDGEFDGLDLTQDIKPPKSVLVEVRVLRDYGELEIEGGETILLTKDSIHSLPRYQCEGLLRQGAIQLTKH